MCVGGGWGARASGGRGRVLKARLSNEVKYKNSNYRTQCRACGTINIEMY